jgi:hypothetical protein
MKRAVLGGMLLLAALVPALEVRERAYALQPAGTASVWHPALNTSWEWELSTAVNQSTNAAMYDIDMFDNDASVVSSLHGKSRHVLCYISAGTWEDWRPDADKFPSYVTGRQNGWPGERWLDIRRLDVLGPIMSARLDLCKQKGFDGVEPDNVNGYTKLTGFHLTYRDQLKYNTFLAKAAHARGLAVALKNDVGQVQDLVAYFDFSLDEQCFQYRECNKLAPFLGAGKPVFEVEYNLQPSQFCHEANSMNFNSIKKLLSLGVWREACR